MSGGFVIAPAAMGSKFKGQIVGGNPNVLLPSSNLHYNFALNKIRNHRLQPRAYVSLSLR